MTMKPEPIARAIGFSRIFGLSDAVALGLSIALGLGLTALSPFIWQLAGEDTPLVYALATILFIPLILSYSERAQEAPGSASCYQLARLGGRAWYVFIVGWLVLAGHIAVAGLLAESVALRVMGILKQLFNSKPDELWVLMVIIALAGLNELFTVGRRSTIRNRLVWLCLLTLFCIVGWALFQHVPEKAELPKGVPLPNWLSNIAMVAGSLWAMEVITGARQQLRDPARTMPLAILIVLVMMSLVGVIVTLLTIRFPDLAMQNILKDLSWSDSRFVLAGILIGIVLCWIGLSRILASGTRLVGAMLNDGFFPRFSDARKRKTTTIVTLLLVFSSVLTLTVSGVPRLAMANVAAITYLWSFLLVMTPYIRRSRAPTLTDCGLKLPLHPFVPVLGCVIALYLSVLLTLPVLLGAAAWVLLGLIYYRLYGFRGNVVAQRKMAVIGDREALPKKGLFRVLVAVKPDQSVSSLIRVSAAVAHANGGELLVLHSQPSDKLLSPPAARKTAENAWRRLHEVISSIESPSVPIRPLIRIAPDPAIAILETAREYKVDFILLGAPSAADDSESDEKAVVAQVFHRTARPVAVVNGAVDQPPRRILVAAAAASNLNIGLRFGRAIGADQAVTITLLSDKPAVDDAEKSDDPLVTIERKAFEGGDLKRTINRQAADHDVLIIGAEVDPATNQAVLDGIPLELAKGRKQQPTVIVKATQPIRTRWLSHLVRIMADILPTLPLSERSEVFAAMSRGARANIDYYMLILLSSAIATLGLILNSGAVIIGAMLVAPLMNPILAIGNGLVLGNFLLMRRGLKAVLNGICIVIAVAAAFVIFLPVQEPGSEILARTEPNVFDLLVALAAGAAAAYGVSRKSVAAALPGVAIAVALVPPLCVVGYGFGTARFLVAGGALLLFATNFAAIIMAGAAVFYFLGFRPSKTTRGAITRKALALAIAGLVVLTIPLGFATRSTMGKRRLDALVTAWFEQSSALHDARLRDITIVHRGDEYSIHLTIHALAKPAILRQMTRKLKAHLEQETGSAVTIDVTAVRAFEFIESD